MVRVLALPDLAEADAQAVLSRAADLSARHQLTNTLETTRGRLAMPGQDLLGSLQDLTEVAASLQRGHHTEFGAPLAAFAPELLEGLIAEQVPHVPTPFLGLNGLLAGGLHSGKLYVLAAPPGSGKTTLAAHIADHAANLNIPVAFAAFEMGRAQLFEYALARAAGINSATVEARTYRHSVGDREVLAATADQYLTTTGSLSVDYRGGLFHHHRQAGDLGCSGAHPPRSGTRRPGAGGRRLPAADAYRHRGPRYRSAGNPADQSDRRQLKQLARISGAAVLALSNITKEAQEAVFKGQEMTLNALHGSNRIALRGRRGMGVVLRAQ